LHFIDYGRVLPFITPFLPTRRKANLVSGVVLCGDIFHTKIWNRWILFTKCRENLL